MKTQTKPKSKFRGFYTALALSLVMIGAACVFAYRQTSQTLEQNLNSLSEQMEVTTTATLPYEAPVVGVQTDVAMETETTVTATSATEETAAPETTPETTAPETEPEETPMHQLTPPLSDFSILNPFSDGELVKSETPVHGRHTTALTSAVPPVLMFSPSTRERSAKCAAMPCGAIQSPSTMTTASPAATAVWTARWKSGKATPCKPDKSWA